VLSYDAKIKAYFAGKAKYLCLLTGNIYLQIVAYYMYFLSFPKILVLFYDVMILISYQSAVLNST